MKLHSVGLVIEDAERVLAAAGVWSPRTDAELLAAYALGVRRSELVLESSVDAAVLERVNVLVTKRADRVPIQHLTGRASLTGMEVDLGAGVFVPRPHSELLLDWSLKSLGELGEPLVVDLCTGSGILALAVAHARPDATVHAVDVDPIALECARRNAAHRADAGDTPIHLHSADVSDPEALDALAATVDLVMANPPYVAEGTTLLPEWSRHHPRHAVYAGSDGLDVIRHVVCCAVRLLRPGGAIAIEHDPSQITSVPELLSSAFTAVENHPDHSGRARYTTARLSD
ncbi:MAG: HemK/PrmC family methyltransferase [Kibdelosporangium sp.]